MSLSGLEPVNERIITARFNTKLAKVTVVQVYAPTEIAPDEEKDIFYDQLQDVLQEVPSFDIKVETIEYRIESGGSRLHVQRRLSCGSCMFNNVQAYSPTACYVVVFCFFV